MGNKLYTKSDLADYADTSNLDKRDRRSAIVRKSLNLSSEEIEKYSTGGYQGKMLFAFRKGGYVWLLKDTYGSCALCDGLLGTHAGEYATTMLNNAYAFESKNDATRFLNRIIEANDSDDVSASVNVYSWHDVAKPGLELLSELY